MSEIEVKALEWRGPEPDGLEGEDVWSSSVFGGAANYKIVRFHDGHICWYFATGYQGRVDTLAAAKAAAQKDFEARILSALEVPHATLYTTPPAEPTPTAAMIEAAWQAYQNCPVDLCGDHDEEQKKSVVAALRAALSPAPSPVGESRSALIERLVKALEEIRDMPVMEPVAVYEIARDALAAKEQQP